MHVFIYTYTYTFIYIYTYTYVTLFSICMQVHKCIHIYICICIYIYIYICVYVSMCIYVLFKIDSKKLGHGARMRRALSPFSRASALENRHIPTFIADCSPKHANCPNTSVGLARALRQKPESCNTKILQP